MKVLKVTACAVVVLIAAGALAAAAAHVVATRKADRVFALDIAAVPLADSADARVAGSYLYRTRGCGDCHGDDGAGKVVIDDPTGLFVRSPNITSSPTSVVARYTPRDWVAAVRHGVKPDGRPLRIMPSEDYARMTDEDLAKLVAYVRALPAATGGPAEIRTPLLVEALYAVGVVRDAAEKIDHSLSPAQPVPVAATPAHGAYVANMCMGCHGPTLAGGKIPGAPPSWPAAADLRASSPVMARYASADAFVAMMRTGKRPDGTPVSAVMPFSSLKQLDETDLAALHLHLMH